MDYNKYLFRIHYDDTIDVSINTLVALQKTHLLHVPFENLDIHLGRPILLEKTYDKVVLQGRGGFCYELNGLFYPLLKEIGFNVFLISARVYDQDKGEYGQEFDHMAIIATINDTEYLVDVGFGEFAFAPLKIELKRMQKDQRGDFLIDTEDGIHYAARKQVDGKLIPQYLFTKTPRTIDEFAGMCHYHQTSPESHFTQKRICSLPTEEGRISLSENLLKITRHDQITTVQLQTETEVKQALWEHFKMKA